MSSISIIGSGNMARGIGTRALAGGNEVQILGRDASRAAALAEELGGAAAGAIGDDLIGDIVVLAVPYDAAFQVVGQYGSALVDKVVVDVTNPVDFATFSGLVVPADSSGAQEIARSAPDGAHVVKAFNTTFAGTLVPGEVEGQQLDVLVAGDDPGAKATLAELVDSAGMRPLDVGELAMARWLEGLGLLHMKLAVARENFSSGIKVVG